MRRLSWSIVWKRRKHCESLIFFNRILLWEREKKKRRKKERKDGKRRKTKVSKNCSKDYYVLHIYPTKISWLISNLFNLGCSWWRFSRRSTGWRYSAVIGWWYTLLTHEVLLHSSISGYYQGMLQTCWKIIVDTSPGHITKFLENNAEYP